MPRMNSMTDFPRNEAGLVGEFIGTAYDTVKRVYDNLPEIQRLDGVLAEIPTLAEDVLAEALPPFKEEVQAIVDSSLEATRGYAESAKNSAESAEANATVALEQLDAVKEDLAKSYGFTAPFSYADGVEIARANQIFSKDGVEYRIKDPADLPYTLTGNWATESEKFTPMGDGGLRQELASEDGGSNLIFGVCPVVGSVANLRDVPVNLSKAVVVTSYFRSGNQGGGVFRWDPAIARSYHDGGTIISPGVIWDGSRSSYESFLNGQGETTPSESGCWVRISEQVFGTDFGMTYAESSAAINKLISTGGRKQLPDGKYQLSSQIVSDFSEDNSFPETGDPSKRFTLEGQSIVGTLLNFAGTGYAMKFVGSKNVPVGQNVHSMLQLSRFALKPANGGSRTCSGLQLINHAYTSLRDLDLEYLDTGLDLNSVITCDFERVYVRSCNVGMQVRGAGFSMPNANDFRRFTAQSNSYAGIVANRIGGGFHMQGVTIENNGTMGQPGNGGFIGNIDGVNGSATLSLTNAYFEANAGDADLLLENISPYEVTVVLTNCNFHRVSNDRYVTNNIRVSNTGGGKVRLVLNGCSFMRGGTYTASSSRPYIQHDAGTEVIDNGCSYSDQVELNHSISTAPVTAGRVNADGSAASLPVGIGSAKISTGTYRISSTTGWGADVNGYVASATCTDTRGGIKVERITQDSGNQFIVVLTNGSGALTDGSFNFNSVRLS